MEEHHIDISFSARYFTYGSLSEKTKAIWFILHGYGQQAKYFIRKFESLDPVENFVVAPEGTHRFYLQGFEGRIGATWMTREDRETDIKNYVGYLNKLYDYLLSSKDIKAKVNVLGFSQGAATVSRWITNGHVHADRLILWAGIFPPDLVIEKAKKELSTKQIFLVVGKNDPYIKPNRLKEMKQICDTLNLQPEELWYEGDHQIEPKIVEQLAATSYLQ